MCAFLTGLAMTSANIMSLWQKHHSEHRSASQKPLVPLAITFSYSALKPHPLPAQWSLCPPPVTPRPSSPAPASSPVLMPDPGWECNLGSGGAPRGSCLPSTCALCLAQDCPVPLLPGCWPDQEVGLDSGARACLAPGHVGPGSVVSVVVVALSC